MSAHPYATMFAGITAGYFVAMYTERTTYKVPAPKGSRFGCKRSISIHRTAHISQDEFVRDHRHQAKATTGAVTGLPTAK